MTQEQLGDRYDVVVVGGGPAGLSGAVALARSRRSVLVIDAGEPRNASAGHAHNYLGREGVAPARLLADGRAELAGYSGQVLDGWVSAITPPVDPPVGGTGDRAEQLPDDTVRDGGFLVELADGRRVLARRLLLATGLTDELPAVPGLAARWGRDVLHCPYCHGWEVRDQPVGVLATGAAGVHQAMMFRQLTADVTLLTHTGPAPGAEQAEQLAARGVRVVDGQVHGLLVEDDRLAGVRLHSGEVVALQALVVAPFFRANAELLTALGLPVTEMRMGEDVVATYVPADPMGATAVPGVWAAGNVTNPQAQVLSSAAAGLAAGAAINADLIAQDTRAAVTAHRAALSGQAAHRHDEPGHQHPPAQADPHPGVNVARMFSQDFWDERYSGAPVFSGAPNPWLVHYAADLPPGTALDVGSGEGADVLWLASRGWQVTGADISPVALARCAQLAEQAGPQTAGRATWQQADMLTFAPPAQSYDLVSAQFLHLPGPARKALHRRLAAAVRPGGTLLLVLHVAPDPHAGHPDFPPDLFATAEQMAAVLDPAQWTIHTAAPERPAADSGNTAGHTHDAVLHAVRHRSGDAATRNSTALPRRSSTSYWSAADARWIPGREGVSAQP